MENLLANLIVPLSPTIFLIPFAGIVLIEAVLAWLLLAKVYKVEIRFSKILIIFLFVNLVTSFIGGYYNLDLKLSISLFGSGLVTFSQQTTIFFILLSMTIIIEWILLILIFRWKKPLIKAGRLFLTALLVNSATYSLFSMFLGSFFQFYRSWF